MAFCDILPQNTLGLKTLSELVGGEVDIPPTFMKYEDSYLIHVKVIIDKNGKYHFNGCYGLNKSTELTDIENKISEILKRTGTWKVRYEANMPVTSQLVIPIVLSK